MPQSQPTLQERLTKYKISRNRYFEESAWLLFIGFTREQANKLILRASSKNAVKSVLVNHLKLLEEPYKLTFAQISAIASHNGGAETIKTLMVYFRSLQALRLSTEEIVRISSNCGGAQAIKTVLSAWGVLRKWGFNKEQIIAIAANTGGTQATRTLINSFDSLHERGFSIGLITAIASNGGGAQAIKTLIPSFDSLQALGFNKKQILAIAARGRMQAMKAVLTYCSELVRYGYSLELIADLASNRKGAAKIRNAYEHKFTKGPNEYLLPSAITTPADLTLEFWTEYIAPLEPCIFQSAENSYRDESLSFDGPNEPFNMDTHNRYGFFANISPHKIFPNDTAEEESFPDFLK